jgi:hypothetical protein
VYRTGRKRSVEALLRKGDNFSPLLLLMTALHQMAQAVEEKYRSLPTQASRPLVSCCIFSGKDQA